MRLFARIYWNIRIISREFSSPKKNKKLRQHEVDRELFFLLFGVYHRSMPFHSFISQALHKKLRRKIKQFEPSSSGSFRISMISMRSPPSLLKVNANFNSTSSFDRKLSHVYMNVLKNKSPKWSFERVTNLSYFFFIFFFNPKTSFSPRHPMIFLLRERKSAGCVCVHVYILHFFKSDLSGCCGIFYYYIFLSFHLLVVAVLHVLVKIYKQHFFFGKSQLEKKTIKNRI